MKPFTKFRADCCNEHEFSTAESAMAHERECKFNRCCESCALTCRRFDKSTGLEVFDDKQVAFRPSIHMPGMLSYCAFWKYREPEAKPQAD